MALGFYVPGPTEVMLAVGGGEQALLGYTPTDDLSRFSSEVFTEPISSSRWGDTVVDHVYRGRAMTLTTTVVEWDDNVLELLLENWPHASGVTMDNEGKLGSIGYTYEKTNNSSGTFVNEIQLRPVIPNQKTYTFPKCLLVGSDAVSWVGWGNEARRVLMNWTVLPDISVAADAFFYTSTNTT